MGGSRYGSGQDAFDTNRYAPAAGNQGRIIIFHQTQAVCRGGVKEYGIPLRQQGDEHPLSFRVLQVVEPGVCAECPFREGIETE